MPTKYDLLIACAIATTIANLVIAGVAIKYSFYCPAFSQHTSQVREVDRCQHT